jgi:hypothetical protein
MGEGFGTVFGADATGDFLLDLDHAQVAFSLIVVKRHLKIIHKRHRFALVHLEPVEQVLRRALSGGRADPVNWLYPAERDGPASLAQSTGHTELQMQRSARCPGDLGSVEPVPQRL